MARIKMDRRTSSRKEVSPIEISSFSLLDNLAKISRSGCIVEASTTGFLIHVRREDLVPVALRGSLTLDSLVGARVLMHLPQMSLEISGKITRSRLMGKRGFEVAVDFTDDAPEYWRECLLDLLPLPGEFEQDEM